MCEKIKFEMKLIGLSLKIFIIKKKLLLDGK